MSQRASFTRSSIQIHSLNRCIFTAAFLPLHFEAPFRPGESHMNTPFVFISKAPSNASITNWVGETSPVPLLQKTNNSLSELEIFEHHP